jgi:hypothetical protein
MKALLRLLREVLPKLSPIVDRLSPVILALLLLAPVGCSTRLIRGNLEKRIAGRLRTLIGPADDYRVRIYDTKDPELVVGSIRRLEVHATNVRAGRKTSIQLESLSLWARGIRFRGAAGEVGGVRESHLEVEISEEALNDYLQRQHRREEARVRLNDGTVTLFGTLRLLGVQAPVETTGRLAIADGRQVVYRAETVSAPTLRLPGSGHEFIERQVNPLVDIEKLDWPVRLETIRVGGGKVTLGGALSLPTPDQDDQ